MSSVIDICNVALSRLGQTQITALTEDDKKARLCNVFYAPMRDALLEEQWWPFATKRETLARLTATPDSEFDYYYQLPSDCLTPRCLVDDTIEYTIEGDRLATDSTADIELVYTKKETDTTKFSAMFADLLAYRIALELVIPLTIDVNRRDRIEAAYERARIKYSQISKRQGRRAYTKHTGWVTARTGAVDNSTKLISSDT